MIAFGDGRTHVATLLGDEAGELADWLARYLPVAVADLFVRPPAHRELSLKGAGNRVFTVPTPNWPPLPDLAFNRLYWPTGATRWAHCFLLATTERKDKILAYAHPTAEGAEPDPFDTAGTLTIAPNGWQGELATQGYVTDDNDIVGLNARMFVLPPRRIVVQALESTDRGTDRALSDGLWIVPLVDQRYFWQHDHVPAGYDPEDWSEAFTAILDGIVAEGTGYRTPSDFDDGFGEPDLPSLEYHNAAMILDALAWSTQRRIVAALNGTISVEAVSDALDTLTDNLNGPHQQIAGGDDLPVRSTVPASLILAFPGGVETQTAEDNGHTEYQDGTAHVVHVPANNVTDDERESFATAFAAEFYPWLSTRYDYSYAGVKAWNPCGYDDAVAVCFDGKNATTRARSLPYNWGATTLLFRANDSSDDGSDPGYPPGVSCNEGNCAEGVDVGSTICCETHPTWTTVIPPFGEVTFQYVSGETWETAEFSRICYGGEDTYLFRRTLTTDADGTFTSTITLVRTSADPANCDEWCLVYQTCCMPRCQCEQPHKLKSHGGLTCCLASGGDLSDWICLKPGTPPATECDVCSVTRPRRMTVDIGAITGCAGGCDVSELARTYNCYHDSYWCAATSAASCSWHSAPIPIATISGSCFDSSFGFNIDRVVVEVNVTGSALEVILYGLQVGIDFGLDACTELGGGLARILFQWSASIFSGGDWTWDCNSEKTLDQVDIDGDGACTPPSEVTVTPSSTLTMPDTDGRCDSPCLGYGGGGGTGGGTCAGTATVQWFESNPSYWGVVTSSCVQTCDSPEACIAAYPGRDGAFDGETVVVDCTCCSPANNENGVCIP